MTLPPLRVKRKRILRSAEAAWRASGYSGSGDLLDLTGRGHGAQLGSAAGSDANDPLFLAPVDTAPYLYLPGSSGNYASVPDEAALDITGDIELTIDFESASWAAATTEALLSKWNAAGTRSYMLRRETGNLVLYLSTDGTAISSRAVAHGLTGSARKTIKAQWRASDGRVQIFVDDVQVGTDGTIAIASIFASTTVVAVGDDASQTGSFAAGKVYSAKIYASIDATDNRLDVDFTDLTKYASTRLTLTAVSGQTVTINRTTSGRKCVVVDRPLFLLGTDDLLLIADHALLDFATTESFTVLIAVRQYATIVANARYINKRAGAAGWLIGADGGSVRALSFISDGTASPSAGGVPDLTYGDVWTLGLRRNVPADTVERLQNGSSTSTTDTTTATLANAAPVYIGSIDTTTGFQDFEFFGAAIFRRALTTDEVTEATAALLHGAL